MNTNHITNLTDLTHIHAQMNRQEINNINICIAGCVSSGKSTILNAFFGSDYAQCKLKRTTMMPNKFVETDNKGQIDSYQKINNTIKDINSQIFTLTQSGTQLNLDDFGGELTFYVESMNMNVNKSIKICIYDIPGLNDARTKDIYYEYLRKNFHKFNIILFVVDIHSGLNTSDEMDILNFLLKNIKEHKTKSNKNIHLLTIINKADDMQLEGNNLTPLGELREMYDEIKNTIVQKVSEQQLGLANLTECIPICGLDSHLYRMIKKFRCIERLSDENILRIGVNEEGSKFRRYSKEDQKRKVQQKIQDDNFVDYMIKLSGFSQIENYLNDFIKLKGHDMIVENIMFEYESQSIMNLTNLVQNLHVRVNVLEQLKQHNNVKYDEEMKKCVKQFNTLVFRKISTMHVPEEIIKYYDTSIIKPIESDAQFKNILKDFFNVDSYPSYFIERIFELVIDEINKKSVSVLKLFYIDLLESIGYLRTETIDLFINALVNNNSGSNTLSFSDINLKHDFFRDIIKIFNKMKKSDYFLVFLRFFLINYYSSNITSDELITKQMILSKYQEIPLRNFIADMRIEKQLIANPNKHKVYTTGLSYQFTSHDNVLELYYITMCREFDDYDNFISHNVPIMMDF